MFVCLKKKYATFGHFLVRDHFQMEFTTVLCTFLKHKMRAFYRYDINSCSPVPILNRFSYNFDESSFNLNMFFVVPKRRRRKK